MMQRGVVGQEDRVLSLAGRNKAPKPCLWQAAGDEISYKNRMCSDSNRHGIVDRHIIPAQPGIAGTKCQLVENCQRLRGKK